MPETSTISIWEDLIHNQRWEELRARLAVTRFADVADAMDQLSPADEAILFRLLSRDHAAQVFAYLPSRRQAQLLHSLSTDEAKNILDSMAPDDRTRFFGELPANVTRQLL